MTLRLRRTALAVAAATALPLIVAPPTAAQDDDHARLIEDRTATASSDRSEAPQVAPTATAEQITLDEETEPVAPGLVHTSFDQYGPRGWVRADVLTAELDQPGLALDYLSSGQVSNPQPLSQMLQREPGFVAGTNADFFDISDTGAPLGVGVDREDGLIHAPADGHNTSLTIEADRAAEITDVPRGPGDDGSGQPADNQPQLTVGGAGRHRNLQQLLGRCRSTAHRRWRHQRPRGHGHRRGGDVQHDHAG